MASLKLNLLGPFEARRPSEALVPLPTRKSEALLAYVSLTPGRGQSRERLINLLWSDRGEEQARNSLRHALSALRKALADLDPAPLVIDRTTIEAAPDAIDVDVLEFENLIKQKEPTALARAAELYRGEFCEGILIRDPVWEEWLAPTRDRYRRMAVEMFEQMLDYERRNGDLEVAIETGERLVRLDPLRESAWRGLMGAHWERGERNHALKAYKRCCEVLARELGVEPEADTTELYDGIRSGLDSRSSTKGTPLTGMTAMTHEEPSSQEPDRPSIAVLPFENLSGDPEQEYFSDGITEGIILGLSWFPSLVVKSRHSCFAFKNERTDVTEVGRLMGVRYVVEGSVRKTPTHIRITAQLVDAKSGSQVWGQRYDSEIERLFSLEDELTRTIVATVRGRIETADQSVAFRRPAKDLRSYDYLMRGTHLVQQLVPEANPKAREMLNRCVELDPENARAHVMLGISYILDWNNRWVDNLDEALQKSGFHSERAVELSPGETLGHASLGEQCLFAQRYEKAEYHVNRAVALNPNDVDARAIAAYVLSSLGKSDEAVEIAESCVGIDPYHPWIGWHLGIVFFTAKCYEKALTAFKSVPNPTYEVHGWAAATQLRLGDLEHARTAMQAFLSGARAEMVTFPATLEEMRCYWRDVSGYRNPSDIEHLFDALLAAGLTTGGP